MSAPHERILKVGRIRGVIYTFDHVNDILPMHSHGENDVHITIVARGEFYCHGPAFGEMTLETGQVIDWDAGIEHEFCALAPASRLVNIIKDPNF